MNSFHDLEDEFQKNHLEELGKRTAALLHEIKNSLSVVFLGLSTLERRHLSERDALRVELALEETLRIQRLVSQPLLDRKHPYSATPFQRLELNSFLQDVLHLTQSSYLVSRCHVRLESAFSQVWVLGNQDQLRQVLINLIQNACEAVSAGDEVKCHILAGASPGRVCVKIHNFGKWIPAQMISEVTQPFVTTKPHGNGLGLAIASRIIKDHKGALSIHSSPTEGTTVLVEMTAACSVLEGAKDSGKPVSKFQEAASL